MARHQDMLRALKAQLDSDLESLKSVQDDQAKTRAAYLRFLDLEKQRQVLRERAEATACLLVPGAEAEGMDSDFLEELGDAGITIPANWREKIPTWRILMEVVRQFPKMQIVELVRTLNDLGLIGISRQGVESALNTHSSKFRITRKGREKFVSLK
jgi:hypothetical protein